MNTPSNSTHLVRIADAGEIPTTSAKSVSFVILGHAVSLKNSRPIRRNRRTGKPFSARSSEAQAFLEAFAWQVPPEYRIGMGSQERPLRMIATVYYPSYRSDLDVAIIKDALQLAGVISNDRWIRQEVNTAWVDKDNPRVELRIEEI